MFRVTGFRTSGLRHVPVEEVFKGILDAGYGAVEFCLEHPEASVKTLLSAQKMGLDVSAVSYHGKRHSPPERLSSGIRAIELAGECDVDTVVFGSPTAGEDDFMKEASILFSLCSERGIKPAWETEPGTVLDSLGDFNRLIVPLGSEAGINLDVGHLHLQGDCTALQIEVLSGRIHHVHIEGMASGDHTHLIPGLGDIDWREVFAGLMAAGYRGPLVLDLFQLPSDWKRYISCANIAIRAIISYSIP